MQSYIANINICQGGKLCKRDEAELVVGNVIIGQEKNNPQCLAFRFPCKAELCKWVKNSEVYLLDTDYSIVNVFYSLIVSFILFFPANVQGKKCQVKPFLGLPTVSKIELASIATDPLSGQLLGTYNSFNPLNGILQAGFHINFPCCRKCVFLLPCFIFKSEFLFFHYLHVSQNFVLFI